MKNVWIAEKKHVMTSIHFTGLINTSFRHLNSFPLKCPYLLYQDHKSHSSLCDPSFTEIEFQLAVVASAMTTAKVSSH